jgi:diguanylate cyclase (GGDEF)-like protein
MAEDLKAILSTPNQMSHQYLQAIIGFTTSVIHTQSVNEVLWLLTDDIIVDLGFEDCVVYLLDDARGVLVQKAAYGPKKAGPSEIYAPIEVPLGEGITGRCAVEQQPILINDVSKEPSYIIDDAVRMSELAVPIISGGRTIGVIDSEHSESNFYTDQHLATLRALSAIITTKYESASALQDLRDSESRLRHLANHDSLCGLPNRHHFVTQLQLAADRFKEGEITKLCVLILDLDRFKLINDSYGHATGDQLIIQVSQRMLDVLPQDVLLARLGGDEFAVLAQNEAAAEPIVLCEQILNSLSHRVPLVSADVQISGSIGVAQATSKICSASELMKLADGAMYKAKANGKGRYVMSNSLQTVSDLSDLNMESAIAAALENDDFEVYLQPIVELDGCKTVGFESLVRWAHAQVGIIRPDYFIDFAERSGQIRDIDLYMIRRVSEVLKALDDMGESELSISVNISASLLSRADWLDVIDKDVFANGLYIEITERALIADVSEATKILKTLQERGSKIYVDDFGTGYSSLSYLHRLPFDVIKIDRSFVESVTESEKSLSLIKLLVSLARTMEVELVAEGIEQPAQLEVLKELGVRYGQGYLFARPMPIAAAFEYLAMREGPKEKGPRTSS